MNADALKKSLGKKVGPLPLGAWVGIVVVGALIARFIRNRNAANAAGQDTTANAVDTSASDAMLAGADGAGYFDDPYASGSVGGDSSSSPGSGGGVTTSAAPSDGSTVNSPVSTDPGPLPTDPNPPTDVPSGDSGLPVTTVLPNTGVMINPPHQDEIFADLPPLATSPRVTAPKLAAAPELISEHGQGGGFTPTPVGKTASPAVKAAAKPAPELVSEHGKGGGYTPAAPARGLTGILSISPPSGNSPAIVPSAVPSMLDVHLAHGRDPEQ